MDKVRDEVWIALAFGVGILIALALVAATAAFALSNKPAHEGQAIPEDGCVLCWRGDEQVGYSRSGRCKDGAEAAVVSRKSALCSGTDMTAGNPLAGGIAGFLFREGRADDACGGHVLAAPGSGPECGGPTPTSWCGLTVAPEEPCPSYDGNEWPYPSDLDQRYADRIGGFFAPYTGRVYASAREVDIEHIVARHEAAQSGACGWTREQRRAFASDPIEITIAGPGVNRHLKSDRDPAEWMPPRAQRWYAARWIAIKRKYGLSIDEAEGVALHRALGGRCP